MSFRARSPHGLIGRLRACWTGISTSDARRLVLLKVTVALAFLVSVALTTNLWRSARSYPLVPVFSHLPAIPPPGDLASLTALVVLLLTIIIIARPQPYLLGLVALVLFLGVWDQSRWQPPFYQYVALLGALSCYSWRLTDSTTAVWTLGACRVIIASTYFWGGIQKLNITFVKQVFPWMIQPFVASLPAVVRDATAAIGLWAPLVEAGIGVALFTPRYRRSAIVLAIAMHGFVLICLGPLGHDWDRLVWPWNVAMAVSVAILFVGSDAKTGLQTIRRTWERPVGKLLILLFALMPALSFVDRWDAYLSWSLYSGNVKAATISVNAAVRDALPSDVRAFVRTGDTGENEVDMFKWSVWDVGVEPYPELRVYRMVVRWICRYASDPQAVHLVVWGKPGILDGKRALTRYDCSTL